MPANQPQDLHTQFANALNTGDLDGLVSLYEDDASLIAGPNGIAQGVAEIRVALAEFLAMKPHIDLSTVRVLEGASDLALLAGRWTLRGTAGDGSAVEMAGTTTEVARRQADGIWLYVLDDPGTGR